MACFRINQPSGELFAAAPSGTVSDAVASYFNHFDDEPVVTKISHEEYDEIVAATEVA